jgi:hypothetical protein
MTTPKTLVFILSPLMVDDEAIVFLILELEPAFNRPTASPLFDLISMIASEPGLVLRRTLEIAMPRKKCCRETQRTNVRDLKCSQTLAVFKKTLQAQQPCFKLVLRAKVPVAFFLPRTKNATGSLQ